jgi:hypothetical protein
MKILFPLAAVTIVLFTSCTNYGKKVKKGTVEIYYKEGIAENEASRTAALIFEIDSTNKDTRSMQLEAGKDTIVFRMVTNKEKLAAVPDVAFQVIGTMISDSAFKGRPVVVELTDDHFKTFKKIPYSKLDLGKLPE